MKCPVCWSDKAYVRPVRGWRGWLLSCLLLAPMQCRHCFHQFLLPWFFAWGKEITPRPKLRIAPASRANRMSHAAECYAAQQAGQQADHVVASESEESVSMAEYRQRESEHVEPARVPVRRSDAA